MQRIINNVKLYFKKNDKSQNVYNVLYQELVNNNFKIVDSNFDLAISIGGDGTFLKMLHENEFNSNLYYIGINTGTLGYLPEIDPDNIISFINKLNNNAFKWQELCYIKTKVFINDNAIEYYALNEIVLRNSDLGVLQTKIDINNHFLEDFAGDGLILSTPTGSTAYNMSLNGAIIDNSLKAYSLMPIASINNRVFKTIPNALILPNETKVSLTFLNKTNILLMNDGKKNELDNVWRIDYKMACSIKLLTVSNDNFIDILNKKIKS